MRDAVDGRQPRALPATGGEQPDAQIRPRPLEAQRVQLQRAEPVGHRLESVESLHPRGDRIVEVEPADVADLLPEARQRSRRLELRIHQLGPSGGGARNRGPVRSPLVDHPAGLPDVGKHVLADKLGRYAVHDVGRRGSGEVHERAAMIAHRQQTLSIPGRHVVEQSRIRMDGTRTLEVVIEDVEVNELCAALVGDLGDRAGHLLLTRLGGQAEDLSRLEICAEHDRELGEATSRGCGVGHRAEDTRGLIRSGSAPRG